MGVRGPFNVPDGSDMERLARILSSVCITAAGYRHKVSNTVGGIEIDHLQYAMGTIHNNAPSVRPATIRPYPPARHQRVTLNGSAVDDDYRLAAAHSYFCMD